MIAAWMFAATLFAALLGVAALAAERTARTFGRQARGAWIAALVVAVSWPAAAPALSSMLARIMHRFFPAAPGALVQSLAATATIVAPAVRRGWAAYVDVGLVALWAVTSIVLLARLAAAIRKLSRVKHSADHDVIDGVPVLVTPALGPAVFGIWRANVVVPRWLFDLDASLRALVVRHEDEHCRARDPQLTLAVAVAVALVPWNAGVWWMARRLRLAMELDCDARVLRHAAEHDRYSRLLLFIAQRQSQVRLAPMLAESNSHLSWRITAMNSPRPSHPRIRAAALVAVAAGALGYSARFASALTAAPVVTLPDFGSHAPSAANAAVRPDSDRSAMLVPGTKTPRYPEALKSERVDGAVLIAVVVDRTGGVLPGSVKILRSTNQQFTEAVVAAVPEMQFLPAIVKGAAVRQVVRLPIIFSVAGSPSATSDGQRAALEKLLADAPGGNFVTLSPIIITVAAR